MERDELVLAQPTLSKLSLWWLIPDGNAIHLIALVTFVFLVKENFPIYGSPQTSALVSMPSNSKDEDSSPLRELKRRCHGGWWQLPRRPVLTFWEDSAIGWSTRVASQVAICKGVGLFAHTDLKGCFGRSPFALQSPI